MGLISSFRENVQKQKARSGFERAFFVSNVIDRNRSYFWEQQPDLQAPADSVEVTFETNSSFETSQQLQEQLLHTHTSQPHSSPQTHAVSFEEATIVLSPALLQQSQEQSLHAQSPHSQTPSQAHVLVETLDAVVEVATLPQQTPVSQHSLVSQQGNFDSQQAAPAEQHELAPLAPLTELDDAFRDMPVTVITEKPITNRPATLNKANLDIVDSENSNCV